MPRSVSGGPVQRKGVLPSSRASHLKKYESTATPLSRSTWLAALAQPSKSMKSQVEKLHALPLLHRGTQLLVRRCPAHHAGRQEGREARGAAARCSAPHVTPLHGNFTTSATMLFCLVSLVLPALGAQRSSSCCIRQQGRSPATGPFRTGGCGHEALGQEAGPGS